MCNVYGHIPDNSDTCVCSSFILITRSCSGKDTNYCFSFNVCKKISDFAVLKIFSGPTFTTMQNNNARLTQSSFVNVANCSFISVESKTHMLFFKKPLYDITFNQLKQNFPTTHCILPNMFVGY